MKVDVAVQSYKKPESLIYTLFTLHKHSRDMVDVVWINDDQSGDGVIEAYQRLSESGALFPWKLRIRENTRRMGWWVSFVKGRRPSYQTLWFRLKRMAWNLYKVRSVFVDEHDLRYQWAISETDKKYLLIIHDDIEFKSDIVDAYMSKLSADPKMGVVGDLGQCWRCDYSTTGCTPQRILEGYRPSNAWPSTRTGPKSHAWACRVNEWSAMVNVAIAREISNSEHVFFGNYDADGDIAAYWFSRLVAGGYHFDDPLPTKYQRDAYYIHWDGGVTGHSVWADQGQGRTRYDAQAYRKKLRQEFGYECDGVG